MPKFPRLVTVRVDAESADALRLRLEAQGATVSGFLRAAIRNAVAAPAGPVAPASSVTAEAA